MADVAAKQFKAVIIGATGATGNYLFAELVKAKEFSEIVALGRRKATIPDDFDGINIEEEEKSGRVKQQIVDLENITNETVGEYFKERDVFFSCLGTTRRQAGSAANFKHIDYGYNYNFAKVARENDVRLYSLMSSQGANKDSFFLYFNSKGKLEHDCGLLKFQQYSIFKPGLLHRGSSARLVERIAVLVMSNISVECVARAMCSDAIQQLTSHLEGKPIENVYFNDQINHMSDTYDLNA